MIDVVIPAHEKDVDTLDLCIEKIRQNVMNVNRVLVLSNKKLTEKAEWYPESELSFSMKDIGDTIGYGPHTPKYYVAILQHLAPTEIEGLTENILINDSDTIHLTETEFVSPTGHCYFNVSYDVPKGLVHHPYVEGMMKFMPGVSKQTEYSGICHHMLLNREITKEITKYIEDFHGEVFWKAFLNVTSERYRTLPDKPVGFSQHENLTLLNAGAYENYFNYCLKNHSDKYKIRPLKSILAYKGRMGVEGEDLHNIGSRTNLMGNVQIIPKEEEVNYKFDNFAESCRFISKRCAELGWDAVTFQNHSRMGAKQHGLLRKKELKELERTN